MPNLKRQPPMVSRRKGSGFSLLEVLITIVVVAIGLLGVAGMQVASIKLADLSQTRSTGVILANDILNRIRAQAGGSANGIAAEGYVTDWGAPPTATATQYDRDLREWKLMMKDAVRGVANGDGKIDVNEDTTDCPVSNSCRRVRIQIRWDEDRQRGGTAQKTFELVTRV
jgi:type IV pilus assembly protein PilV